MNVVRNVLGAILSTSPTQRPMIWPALFMFGGSLLMVGPLLLTGHRDWTLAYCGMALSTIGLVLGMRYFILRAAARRRSGASSRTKVV
jgi:hypothetical protein